MFDMKTDIRSLDDGYKAMAADELQEKQAQEWINDAFLFTMQIKGGNCPPILNKLKVYI